MQTIYTDRQQAGAALAHALTDFAHNPSAIVLGLPRGGVVVAAEVAHELHLPLDGFIVRKQGVPGHEELATGAVAGGGIVVVDERLIATVGVARDDLMRVVREEMQELDRREKAYRGDRAPVDVKGRIVILVDDGLATGSTMRAALEALRRAGPVKLIVAVPVGPPETCRALEEFADEVICATTPEPFYGVGMWYEDFDPTTDEEVQRLLAEANQPVQAGGRGGQGMR